MNQFLLPYALSFLALVSMDAVWLRVIAKQFYATHLGGLMASSVTWWAVGAFYVLYPVGVVLLVVLPALQGDWSLLKVFLFGALLGLMAYGAYDFTNQATLKNWPVVVTFVDLLWGVVVTGCASGIAVALLRVLGR